MRKCFKFVQLGLKFPKKNNDNGVFFGLRGDDISCTFLPSGLHKPACTSSSVTRHQFPQPLSTSFTLLHPTFPHCPHFPKYFGGKISCSQAQVVLLNDIDHTNK